MTELAASAITTLADVKTYLRMTKAADDELLKRLINIVSADCQNRHCQRLFLKQTHTDEVHDGNDSDTMFMKHYPIVSVASITKYKNATALTVLGTDFDFDADAGEIVLLSGHTFTKSYREVKITYDAGFDGVSNVPDELRFSIDQGVAHKYQETLKKSYHVERQDIGGDVGGSVDYISTEYPKHVLDIWKKHKRKLAGYGYV